MAKSQAFDVTDAQLRKSWFRIRTDPAGYQAERRGVEAMKLRAIAILTGGL